MPLSKEKDAERKRAKRASDPAAKATENKKRAARIKVDRVVAQVAAIPEFDPLIVKEYVDPHYRPASPHTVIESQFGDDRDDEGDEHKPLSELVEARQADYVATHPNWTLGTLADICGEIVAYVLRSAETDVITVEFPMSNPKWDGNLITDEVLKYVPDGPVMAPGYIEHEAKVERRAVYGWIVNVSNVKYGVDSGNQFEHPEAGNVYVTLDITFTNKTSKSQSANPLYFKLIDGNGVKHDMTSISTCPLWSAVDIAVGGSYGPKCTAFEAVAGKPAGLVLDWTPTFIGGDYKMKLT